MDAVVPAPAGTELTHLIDWLLLRGLTEEEALACVRYGTGAPPEDAAPGTGTNECECE